MTTTDSKHTEALHAIVPLARHLGIEVVEWAPERVVARLDWAAEYCTAGGMLHGGIIMALADTAGATCAYSNLPEQAAGTTTIESKTNFLRGVADGHVEATSKPLHRGRTLIVVETDITDSTGRRVARVTQTQAVLGAG